MFRYSDDPLKWQTHYTRDDAYRDFGRYARHYKYIFLVCIFVVSGYIAFRFSPGLDKLASRFLGSSQALSTATSLVAFLLSIIAAYIALHFARAGAFRFAISFFTDFHQSPQGIDPAGIIKYRLNGKFKLPPPFTQLFQFKYLTARDGEIIKADEWPAWMARTLGGPLVLIVFDGCALYLERGNRFSRVVGPGEKPPFLEWFETIKYVVDLRPKVRLDQIHAWTKDGIRVDLKIRVESRIGDPQKKDPDGKLIYPFDPLAVKKAIEHFAVRWPKCPEGDPEEFTCTDAVWGQVTSVVPDYIGSRRLDDLFVANEKGGQILSPESMVHIKFNLNESTKGFGVYIIDFQVTEVHIPELIEQYQKEYWKAEKQGRATKIDGETKAYRIQQREGAHADTQLELIRSIANGLKENRDGQFTEPVLLSLSGVIDKSLREPLTRAYLAKETLDTLEQLQKILEDPANQ